VSAGTGGLSHLTGSPVVITGVGGLGQVGEAVARAFANAGAVVHCIGRGGEVRERVAELTRDGHSAHAHVVDLADFDATSRLAGSIAHAHAGRVAVVAALAGGFAASGEIAESDPLIYARQISINLTTAYSTARAFAAPVRAARGVFVFVTSAAVLPDGKPARLSAYAMAKAGVQTLVRVFADEERESGMRIYAVAPTSIRTAANLASMGENVRYVEREDFSATLLAMSHPSFAMSSGQLIKLG
jgi:NAD(P)-dependent dehydrogenase (short-subunit alcohol dehydrogenase family)